MPRRNWTREELIVALNLYCKIPFKDSHAHHPLVIEYAKLIDRTPAAMNFKIGNLGRFDPILRSRNITGLRNGSKLDEKVWNEFMDNPESLAYESERIIAQYKQSNIEKSTGIKTDDLPVGKERSSMVRQRVNQHFFRHAVIVAYQSTCCVTGISVPSLIDACHISPWSEDVKNRTNPQNGLCLNSFFHRAFDDWLFTINPEYKIEIKEQLIDTVRDNIFKSICGRKMLMPEKFAPDTILLEKHYDSFIKRN